MELLKISSNAPLDMPQVFSALSNSTRLSIMQELDRQRLIPFSRFKELLELDNESTLNDHLGRLAKTGLIRKSSHVNAWELTEQGSMLLNLIESLKGENKQVVGPVVSIIISGTLPFPSFSDVENSLRSRRSLQTISRTPDSLSVRIDDEWSDVTLEISADGKFTAKGKIPLTSVLSITKADDLRKAEDQFVNFFNLVPDESRDKLNMAASGKVQSWILMANGLVWSVVYFLFSNVVHLNVQSTLASIRYWAVME